MKDDPKPSNGATEASVTVKSAFVDSGFTYIIGVGLALLSGKGGQKSNVPQWKAHRSAPKPWQAKR